jgi:GTP-binding protein Era
MPNAGFVAIAGKPNAGKSTLLNRLVGEKLAITSPKPQSTRDRVVGIRSEGDVQMVLLDTPGLLDPEYALHVVMRGVALHALREADVVIYVADATEGSPAELPSLVPEAKSLPGKPVILALNKADRLAPAELQRLQAVHPDAVLVSAYSGEGIEALIGRVGAVLPESPFLYPGDELSTQSMRFFVAELIRETALEQLDEEVPYSVACEIEEFRETKSPVYIRAVIHVERDTQKAILIGAGGTRIKELGKAARAKIEVLVGGPVYLDLWVKVTKNWRRSVDALRRFGYRNPEEGQR